MGGTSKMVLFLIVLVGFLVFWFSVLGTYVVNQPAAIFQRKEVGIVHQHLNFLAL